MSFLQIDWIRFHFVKARYLLLRHRMRIERTSSTRIGESTISHNLDALQHNAAFGCGGRMGLLIHPVIAFHSFHQVDRAALRVLMVGCRTEDDVYWMRAYGFTQAIGFDLFSYSPHVRVGDIHDAGFPDGSFDVVILGWMLSYTQEPERVIRECARMLAPGGLLGIGIEHDPSQVGDAIRPPRVNPANSTRDLLDLMDRCLEHQVVFQYDHHNDRAGDFSAAVVVLRR